MEEQSKNTQSREAEVEEVLRQYAGLVRTFPAQYPRLDDYYRPRHCGCCCHCRCCGCGHRHYDPVWTGATWVSTGTNDNMKDMPAFYR